VSKLAARIVASPDLYPQPDREPNRSINFITAHDGFTLYDLVSYNHKHNLANGEYNRDGLDENFSWNCGLEGDTRDPAVLALRKQQMKNFLVILMLSQGTPMLLMGDEMARTQRGNNNGYCQDNALSWFDWAGVDNHAGMLRFTRQLIHFTQGLQVLREERYLSHNPPLPPNLAGKVTVEKPGQVSVTKANIAWHGVQLGKPDWGYPSHSLAFRVSHDHCTECLFVMVNAYWEPLSFELPASPVSRPWRRVIDTARPSPEDILPLEEAPVVATSVSPAAPRSVVVLMAAPA